MEKSAIKSTNSVLGLLLLFILIGCTPKKQMPITEFSSDNMEANAILVDVRTPEEFEEGHLPGAINIDWLAADFKAHWADMDPSKKVYVYCQKGGRSARAAAALDSLGFEVIDLTGGYEAFAAAKK
ncbi:rhodanese-like domain-containing protein [Robiginitalea sp. IMCC44478]|uniref:rhodanese-like domain-containing protein n=1 Tax=Robiginitalea sp. IMCC44478 TaxID=3459122 RepID=UPI00404347AA